MYRMLALAALASVLGACATSRSLDESFADLSGNAELKAVLFTDRSHNYSDVDITLYEGRLLLTGTMASEEGHAKLIANAWKADSVDEVIDAIFVGDRTSFGQGFEDARIDQTLRTKLIADGDVVSTDYKIAVSGAVVYVIGAAANEAQRTEVIELARSISGVEKVVSYIELRNPPSGALN